MKMRETDPRIAAYIAADGLARCILGIAFGIIVTVLAIVAKHYNYIG